MALGVQKSVIASALTDFNAFVKSFGIKSGSDQGAVISVTEHKPEINSRAACEIALAGGRVEQPVCLQHEMDAGCQGVLDAEEGGDGREGVAAVGGRAVVEDEVAGGVLEGCHVLHSATADGDSREREPFAERKHSIDEQAAPARVLVAAVFPVP